MIDKNKYVTDKIISFNTFNNPSLKNIINKINKYINKK